MRAEWRGPKLAQYYHTARTAHLERLGTEAPVWFYFSVSRADFDAELAASIPYVCRKSSLEVALLVIRGRIDILELPEPLAVRIWPQLVLIHAFAAIARALGISKIRLVSYAIESYPTDRKLAEFAHLPRFVARSITRIVAGFLVRTTWRMAFGTLDAERNYASQLPRATRRKSLAKRIVWALPSASTDVDSPESPGGPSLVFLGTFEHRKGITRLMRVWPQVVQSVPGATLHVLGKSGDLLEVRAFAGRDSSVKLNEDPSRDEIARVLRTSRALVLFSQPALGWREQVGLPIVEGLSYGCEIVSSDQTGIADWLRSHGHQVVKWDATGNELCSAIVRALESKRTKAEILDDLPKEDGRASAKSWLFRDPGEGD